MGIMMRILWMPGLLVCLPLAAGGCARTGDGTVVIPKQVDYRRIWDPGPSTSRTPLGSEAAIFPVAPQMRKAAARRAGTPRHARAQASAPAASMAPGQTLTCRDATARDGRVRVDCE